MPNLVPACETSKIATMTTAQPMRIVTTDSHQFIPSEIMPLASEYVGRHKHIPTHSEANFDPGHECSASVHGRRSSFHIAWLRESNAASDGVSTTTSSKRSCVNVTTALPANRSCPDADRGRT